MSVIRKLFAAAAIAFAAGCAVPVPRVLRGEVLSTGRPPYDEFFAAVRQVHSEAEAAPGDEEASHTPLLKALGLEPKSRIALALEESSGRAKKLHDKGILLHLEVAPEARMMMVKTKAELGAEGDALVKAMEEAAKTSLEMRRRFALLANSAAELEKKRIVLREQAPVDFRADPQAKREEVIAELDAAQTVIAESLAKANASAGAASRFVVELAQAVETGALDAPQKVAKGGVQKRPVIVPAAPPPAVLASAPPAAAPPKPAPPKPAAAAPPPAKPAAAPPPKKKAKGGGDDFEP